MCTHNFLSKTILIQILLWKKQNFYHLWPIFIHCICKKTLKSVFPYIHELYNIQQTIVDIVYYSQKVNYFSCQLQNDRQDSTFQTFWGSAIAQTKEGDIEGWTKRGYDDCGNLYYFLFVGSLIVSMEVVMPRYTTGSFTFLHQILHYILLYSSFPWGLFWPTFVLFWI